MKDKKGFLVAIATLLIAIIAISTLHIYLEIYIFCLTMEEKLLILKEVDRKTNNIADIQFSILSKIFKEKIKELSKKGLSKNEVKKQIRSEYIRKTAKIWNQSELKSYLNIKNQSLMFWIVNVHVNEYRTIEKGNTLRIIDGKKIYPRSICSITEVNFSYENGEYGVFYKKNEVFIACIPLRYFKLYDIGHNIIKKLKNKEISNPLPPEDFIEKYISSISGKDGVIVKYSISCVPIDSGSASYICTLDFFLVDLYAKNSDATIYRVDFPKVKFYYKRLSKS
ncbi:MAG: hypothetical protein DRJ38_01700 [Thermoprotei archaeon]|nr:MAG: hypothetical protein DRJ38_01700 [Thermoprotei archaeon]